MSELLDRSKRKKLEAMLRMGRGLVMVHLDPRRDGVVVPEYLSHDPVLRLNLAYGFNLPALDIDDSGVFAILSFGGRNFGCTLPWHAIFAMTRPGDAHAGVAWPESTPPELAAALAESDLETPPPPPTLSAVDGGRSADPDHADAEPSDDEPAARPKLRLVE